MRIGKEHSRQKKQPAPKNNLDMFEKLKRFIKIITTK